MREGDPSTEEDEPLALRIPVGTNLAEAERWMILATLEKCGGNKTRAAALLGVSLKTLYNRLHAYRGQGVLGAGVPPTYCHSERLSASIDGACRAAAAPGRQGSR